MTSNATPVVCPEHDDGPSVDPLSMSRCGRHRTAASILSVKNAAKSAAEWADHQTVTSLEVSLSTHGSDRHKFLMLHLLAAISSRQYCSSVRTAHVAACLACFSFTTHIRPSTSAPMRRKRRSAALTRVVAAYASLYTTL